MYIKSIRVKNYRNYEQLKIDFDRKLNIIVGDNAQGKTNLLEAVYVSGFGKSFRTNKDGELVNFKQQFTSVKLEVVRDNGLE